MLYILWQPGLVSEPPTSNQHTNWSLLKAKIALLFKQKLYIYQTKQNPALEESTVLFHRVEPHHPRRLVSPHTRTRRALN